MPDTVYSALNTGGTEVVSEAERLRAQLRQQAIDNAFRGQMLGQQNTLAMAELADRGNDRASRLQGIGLQNSGNLAVESQRGQNQLGVAQIDTAPAMGELGLRRDQYNEGKPLRDAEMQSKLADIAFQRQLLDGIGYGGQSALAGQTVDGAAQDRAAAAPAGNGLRTQYVTPGSSGGFTPPFKGGGVSSGGTTSDRIPAIEGGTGVPLEDGAPMTLFSTVPRGTGYIQNAGRPETRMKFAEATPGGESPAAPAAPVIPGSGAVTAPAGAPAAGGLFGSLSDADRRKIALGVVGAKFGLGDQLNQRSPQETMADAIKQATAMKLVDAATNNPDAGVRAQAAASLKAMGFDIGAGGQAATASPFAPTGATPDELAFETPADGRRPSVTADAAPAAGALPYMGTSTAKPEEVASLIDSSLPDYLSHDTSTWYGRAAKEGAIAGGAGAAGGAVIGAIPTFGLGAPLGAAIGGGLSAVGGAIHGAFTNPAKPTKADEDQLVNIYIQLVKAYQKQTGDPALAKQLAYADFVNRAKKQDPRFLTDGDATMTRDLFSKLQQQSVQ